MTSSASGSPWRRRAAIWKGCGPVPWPGSAGRRGNWTRPRRHFWWHSPASPAAPAPIDTPRRRGGPVTPSSWPAPQRRRARPMPNWPSPPRCPRGASPCPASRRICPDKSAMDPPPSMPGCKGRWSGWRPMRCATCPSAPPSPSWSPSWARTRPAPWSAAPGWMRPAPGRSICRAPSAPPAPRSSRCSMPWPFRRASPRRARWWRICRAISPAMRRRILTVASPARSPSPTPCANP